jgi:hypothetical protein
MFFLYLMGLFLPNVAGAPRSSSASPVRSINRAYLQRGGLSAKSLQQVTKRNSKTWSACY